MGKVLVDKKILRYLCDGVRQEECKNILGKDCDSCGRGNECREYLFNYLINNQEKENDRKELTEWKFSIPNDTRLFHLCQDKIKKITGERLLYAHNIIYNNGFVKQVEYNEDFINCQYKELTPTEFLALAEPQQKKKLPEWVNKDNLIMFKESKNQNWKIVALLRSIYAFETFCEFDTIMGSYRIAAPFDKKYYGAYNDHPQQLTGHQLKDYDLSGWVRQ